MSVKIPVIHDPNNKKCPKNFLLNGCCLCTSRKSRAWIAEDIIRRVDTVTLLKCEEVDDIRRRAAAGEFDGYESSDP